MESENRGEGTGLLGSKERKKLARHDGESIRGGDARHGQHWSLVSSPGKAGPGKKEPEVLSPSQGTIKLRGTRESCRYLPYLLASLGH